MSAKVLISGAGPVGLSLACFLRSAGVDVDVVDSKPATVTDSRALGIHARTLEIFQSLEIAREVIRRGRITRYMTFHDANKELFSLDFDVLKAETAYPYYLILPQSETEDILYRRLQALGGTVHWQTPLRSFVQDSTGVSVNFADQSLRYDYLIGCDGANSLVRQSLGIPFEGITYDARFVLSEVRIDEDRLRTDATHVLMAPNTMIAAIPMPNGAYRLVGPDAAAPAEGPSGAPMSFQSFAGFLDRNNLLQGVNFRDADRVLSYNMHKRVAARFMDQRVFLAGDAAHIHSPAGGQGMNTGIQDAANLAWKLALVLKGTAKPSLLDSYESERHRVASRIANGTDQAMRIVGSKSLWMRGALRLLAPLALRFVQPKGLMRRMAQLSISLRPTEDRGKSLTVGDRLPWVPLADGEDLFDKIEPGRLLCLTFGREAPAEVAPDAVKSLSLIDNRYFRPDADRTGRACPVLPAQLNQFRGVTRILVRPDGYIAALDRRPQDHAVQDALSRIAQKGQI